MMISNEEIIQILKDNSELGTIGWTVKEAMFEDVAKQIQGKVQNLNIDLVSGCPFEAYAVFCIECDRQGIKPIKHKDYLEMG